MQRVDRRIGAALTVLGAVVLWSARSFPAVPGQKLGAGFLPMLIGAGLLLCGLVLVLRGQRDPAGSSAQPAPASTLRDRVSALAIIVAVLAYIGLAERLGFLHKRFLYTKLEVCTKLALCKVHCTLLRRKCMIR